MIQRLWRYLCGYVVVKVKGSRLEGFLNRTAGIGVWDVERLTDGMLIARMPAAKFRRTRHLSRRQGWQVYVVDRIGLPFVIARLVQRKALAVGAIAAVLALYVASGFIWFVRIESDVGIPDERILAVAAEAGLRPGVRSTGFDPQQVQLALLLGVDELSWAAVNLKGTVAVIELAERSTPSEELTRPGDVVAQRDGIIEKIAVSRGHPLVKPGDTVRRGDILISGFIPPEDPNHRRLLDAEKAPYVRADGVVTARVWYEGRGRVRLTALEEEPTGRQSWRLEVRHGENGVTLGKGEDAFTNAQVSQSEWKIPTFGPEPLSLTFTRFREVRVTRTTLSEQEARRLAQEAALAELEARVPEEAEVVEGPYVEIESVESENGMVVQATAYAEIVDDIRGYRAYP